VLPKWAWSGSREQFLHCGLRKFRHSKSSVYRWYRLHNSTVVGLFMTHCLRLNVQLHTISLVRTCRISSFRTVAWQLARLLYWQDASRGHSAIAELLVWTTVYKCVLGMEWCIGQDARLATKHFTGLTPGHFTFRWLRQSVASSLHTCGMAHCTGRYKQWHGSTCYGLKLPKCWSQF